MLQSASRSLGLALLAGFLLVGCSDNLFSGLQSEGTSDDPQVLLADAQAALAKGDTTRALDYLERAHDLEPENAEVRVTLVGTRFEKHNVDLLTIREIGEYIASGSNPSVMAKAAPNYVCSFEEDPSNYATFDFAAAPSFQRLVDLSDLFADAETLIGDLDATQVDLPDDLRARMLLIRAFMQAFKTIKEIDYEVKQLGVQLFRLPNNDLGICADANQLNSISDAQQIVDDIQDLITCTLLPGYEQAMEDLLTRNRLLNGSEDNIVIDVMSDALDAMRNSLNAECTAN